VSIEKIAKLVLVIISLVLLGTVVPTFFLPDYAHSWALSLSGGTMFPHQGQGFSLAENTLVLKLDEEAFLVLEAACLHWIHTAYHLAYAGLILLGIVSEGFLALTRWNLRKAKEFCREVSRQEKEILEKKQEIEQSVEALARRDEKIVALSNERDNRKSEIEKVYLWRRSHEILANLQAGLASLQQPAAEEVEKQEN